MALNAFMEELARDGFRIVKTQPFPDRWRAFCDQYTLDWVSTPFVRTLVEDVADSPGVYCFHIGHTLNCLPAFGVSLYGGISERSLRTRFREYFYERDSTDGRIWVRKFLYAFEGELTFAWSEVDTAAVDITILEREFNDAMMPPYSIRDFSADVRGGRNAWQF